MEKDKVINKYSMFILHTGTLLCISVCIAIYFYCIDKIPQNALDMAKALQMIECVVRSAFLMFSSAFFLDLYTKYRNVAK
ncbi:MAG: hypothetical protein IKU52_06960 [Clostridia bacterium]|nr:hypothetical protein [Clostridia bacterium]